MKCKISARKNIAALSEAFNKEFPYLKIEFFRAPHRTGEASPKKEMIDTSLRFDALRPRIKEGMIRITASQTVNALERAFREKFGLHVQVFRRQKEVWIETTKTDCLTLQQQNEMGREASLPVKEPTRDRFMEESAY